MDLMGVVRHVSDRSVLIKLDDAGHIKVRSSGELNPGDRVLVDMTDRTAIKVDD